MTTRTLKIEDAARHGAELPTPERLAKAPSIRVTEAKDGTRAVWVGDDSPIGRLASQGLLSARQHQAGLIFTAKYFVANGSGGRAQSFDPPVSGGSGDLTDRQVDAKKHLVEVRNLVGERLYVVLEGVCGHGHMPGAFSQRVLKLDPRIGPDRLRSALDLYANNRGLPPS